MKNHFILFFLILSCQTIAQEFFTMIMNPSGKLTFDWQDGTQTQLTCYYDRGEKRYSSTNDPDCRLDVVSNDSGIADDAT